MTTIRERTIELLQRRPAGLDDDEIARELGLKYRQQARQACVQLEAEGLVVRRRVEGKIRNFWLGNALPDQPGDSGTSQAGKADLGVPPSIASPTAASTGKFGIVGECLNHLLGLPELSPALRQRAKFEGWFKIELAHALHMHGVPVLLEAAVAGTRHRADLQVKPIKDDLGLRIMLKTVNTNFRFKNVVSSSPPITENISGVIKDVDKLRSASDCSSSAGLVVFPVFPVATEELERSAQLELHINRVIARRVCLEEQGFLIPPASDGSWGVAWFIFRV